MAHRGLVELALLLAIVSSEVPATQGVLHSTQLLGTARRDLGGTGMAGAGVAVFGGGCTDAGEFSCTTGSATIDVLKPPPAAAGVTTTAATATAQLSLGRGWPAVCGWTNGSSVVFLGGGTSGSRAHKPVVDVLDLTTLAVRSSATALDAGRWGTSCVEGGDGTLYFGGGKEVVGFFGKYRMTDEVLAMATPDPAAVRLAPWKLSVARECTGAASLPRVGIFFAGGWISWTEPGSPFAGADAFPVPAGTGTAANYSFDLKPQGANAYWQGAAGWDDETAFIADDAVIYEVTAAVFNGSVAARTWPLPAAAAGGITAARMNGNGVAVPDGVCFYSAATAGSVLACFHPAATSWTVHRCDAFHVAGAMAVVPSASRLNATVFVAGGQAGTGEGLPTATVDVFQF